MKQNGKTIKVFLGGTVNGSKWRNIVIEKLKIDYFNPVIEEWNDEAYQRELYERKICDFSLYVLTPKMTGFYSLAEVIDDSYKRPRRTLYCYLEQDARLEFSETQINSLDAMGAKIVANGGTWYKTLDEIVKFLNLQQNAVLAEY